MFKLLTLLAFAALSIVPVSTSAEAERKSYDISCEICRMKERNGDACKGKVTRGLTDRDGIRYTCSNGHTFIVPPKVRVN
ncbi:MAG: hypothetical protein RI910_675 [Verrucomicrobiota bacterium]|jgi:hypothetical protein